MAAFCRNCGAQLDGAAKFCASCGTQTLQQAPQAQQPPFQQPYPQQQPPYPQQQYQQPAYPQQPYQQPYPQQPYPSVPAAMPKKKRTGLKVFLALLVVAGLAAGVVVVLGLVDLGKADAADYYKIGKDQIPSVKLALGDMRVINERNSSAKNGVTTQEFKYSEPERDQASEMSQYLDYLQEQGFALITEADFGKPASRYKVGRASEDAGYEITLEVSYDTQGYAVTIVKQRDGSAPNNEDPPATTKAPKTTKGGGGDFKTGKLSGFIFDAFSKGTYHYGVTVRPDEENDFGGKQDMYAKNGMMAFTMESDQGGKTRSVTKDGKSYTIIDSTKTVMVTSVTGESLDLYKNPFKASGITYVGQGSTSFKGKTRQYDEYKHTTGEKVYFFVDGGKWVGMRTFSSDGSVHDMEIDVFDTKVPDSVFDIPKDYKVIDMDNFNPGNMSWEELQNIYGNWMP